MTSATIIILLSSLGFIIIGLVYLKSEKIKLSLEKNQIYKDTNKFIKINGLSNLIIGLIGILIGIINYFNLIDSNTVIFLFVILILIQYILQMYISKKNKNI